MNVSWNITGHPIVGVDFEVGLGDYFGASVSIYYDRGIVAVMDIGSTINRDILNSGAVIIFQFERYEWLFMGRGEEEKESMSHYEVLLVCLEVA